MKKEVLEKKLAEFDSLPQEEKLKTFAKLRTCRKTLLKMINAVTDLGPMNYAIERAQERLDDKNEYAEILLDNLVNLGEKLKKIENKFGKKAKDESNKKGCGNAKKKRKKTIAKTKTITIVGPSVGRGVLGSFLASIMANNCGRGSRKHKSK